MTGETPPLLFSAMAKKKNKNKEQHNKQQPPKNRQAKPKKNKAAPSQPPAKPKNVVNPANYTDESKRKAVIANPDGNVASVAGLDSKRKLQKFASLDTKKYAKEKIDNAISGFHKNFTRQYAEKPIAKLLHKAMGGGALAGMVSSQMAKIFRDPIRNVIEGGLHTLNKKSGNMLDKAHNKITDFAGNIAHKAQQGTLKYGEAAGFLPKGATERYNDPKKQAHYQAQQERLDIRDKTINKGGAHQKTVQDYRKGIKEARKAGDTAKADKLLKESRSYSKESKKGILKSGQRRKTSGDRYQVQYGQSGFQSTKSPGKGYVNKALSNMAGTLGVGKHKK